MKAHKLCRVPAWALRAAAQGRREREGRSEISQSTYRHSDIGRELKVPLTHESTIPVAMGLRQRSVARHTNKYMGAIQE